jgi:hypothetical protein
MSGILSRIARFFSVQPRISELPSDVPEVTPETAFAPIDSNAETVGWFNGGHVARAQRDSIESNPDTARWYRKPRFVSPNAAAHRTSLVGGGR